MTRVGIVLFLVLGLSVAMRTPAGAAERAAPPVEVARTIAAVEGAVTACMPLGRIRETGTGQLARWGSLPGTGAFRGRVILVDYIDAAAAPADFDRIRAFTSVAENRIAALSGNNLQVTFDVRPSSVRLPVPASTYASTVLNSLADARNRLISDLLSAFPTLMAGVDFVWIRESGPVRPIPFASTTATFASTETTADAVTRAIVANRPTGAGPTTDATAANTIAHEFLHMLGLPDLYDESSRAEADVFEWMGAWDPMSNSSAPTVSPWHRWELGWIGGDSVRCVTEPDATLELAPGGVPGRPQLAVVRTGRDTAIGVEVRAATTTLGCGGGVLIYNIDASRGSGAGSIRAVRARIGPEATGIRAGCRTAISPDDALFDLGPGRNSTYTDPLSGVRIEVLPSATPNVWRVRIRQAGPPTMRLAVFAGGATSQLGTAFGCVNTDSAYWVTEAGRFLTYVPAAPAVVNVEWLARFAGGIPASTAMVVLCGTGAKVVALPPTEPFTLEPAGRLPVSTTAADGAVLTVYALRMVAPSVDFATIRFSPADRYGPLEGQLGYGRRMRALGRDSGDPTLLNVFVRTDAPAGPYAVRVLLPDGRWADQTVSHVPAAR